MPTLLERAELSDPMKKSLRNHIIREREKKKREEKEAEKDFERRAKIEEERKRKEKEDSVNLEQIKEQLSSSVKKLETLKTEKHQLFTQLKKVLQEEEKRKKEKEMKEIGEMNAAHYGHPIPNLVMPGGHYQPHHMQYYSSQHGHPSLRPTINQVHQSQTVQHGVKRPHSPVSPQPSPIQLFQRNALATHGHSLHLPAAAQHPKYDHGYNNHPNTHLGVANSSNPSGQSSLIGTPSRHISVLHSGSPNRISGSKSPFSLPKTHDNLNPMTNFGEDSMSNLASRSNIRMMPQQSGLIPQQISASPRSRSGSPGRFPVMHGDKSHSPYHGSSPIAGGRFYK